jgi:hypothetical protein
MIKKNQPGKSFMKQNLGHILPCSLVGHSAHRQITNLLNGIRISPDDSQGDIGLVRLFLPTPSQSYNRYHPFYDNAVVIIDRPPMIFGILYFYSSMLRSTQSQRYRRTL